MKLIVSVLVIATVAYEAYSLCNVCSATTGLACVAADKFSVCKDGVPSSDPVQCPTGTVCTPNAMVCAPEGSVPSSCAKCQTCNSTKTFACKSYNSFTLCGGTDDPIEDVEYICPEGLVCNVDSATICVDSVTTGLGATCPFSEPVTTSTEPTVVSSTTPNAATNPNEYCASRGFPGRYEVASDTTCQSYISCILQSGSWSGNLYECPKDTYFSPISQMCGVTKPTRCT